TEYVRQSLAPQITSQFVTDNQPLKVVTVSGKVEKIFAESIQRTEHGNYLAMDTNIQEQILHSVKERVEQLSIQQETPIILCSPPIRMYLRKLLERVLPEVVVLSYNELEAYVEVQSIGVVDVK